MSNITISELKHLKTKFESDLIEFINRKISSFQAKTENRISVQNIDLKMIEITNLNHHNRNYRISDCNTTLIVDDETIIE